MKGPAKGALRPSMKVKLQQSARMEAESIDRSTINQMTKFTTCRSTCPEAGLLRRDPCACEWQRRWRMAWRRAPWGRPGTPANGQRRTEGMPGHQYYFWDLRWSLKTQRQAHAHIENYKIGLQKRTWARREVQNKNKRKRVDSKINVCQCRPVPDKWMSLGMIPDTSHIKYQHLYCSSMIAAE